MVTTTSAKRASFALGLVETVPYAMEEHDVTWKKNSKLSKASCDSKKCLSVTRSPSFASDCPTRNSSATSDCLTRFPSDASIVSRFTSFAADSEEDSEEEVE